MSAKVFQHSSDRNWNSGPKHRHGLPRGRCGRSVPNEVLRRREDPIRPRALPANPLTLIRKKFEFDSNCSIPLHPACSECLRKERKECMCFSVAKYIAKEDAYSIDEVQSTKVELNRTRSQLDNVDIKEWKAHTSRTVLTSDVVRTVRYWRPGPNDRKGLGPPEMVTNAWCKMYEILRACQFFNPEDYFEKRPVRTVHLCECPGAFICATNHFLKTAPEIIGETGDRKLQLDWLAVSLNPYFEGNDLNAMIDDDAFYRHTYFNWLRGEDDSGNIKRIQNINHFRRTVLCRETPAVTSQKADLPKDQKNKMWLADLITADGSVDSQFDANEQEAITASLHFAELVCAVGMLNQNGHFVMKMFTLFEHQSLSILALMSCLFKDLMVLKPMMSRDGSGEVYVVGKGFLGISSTLLTALQSCVQRGLCDAKSTCAIFPKTLIHPKFWEQFTNCSRMFADYQRQAIQLNWQSFCEKGLENIRERRLDVARDFLSYFAIQPIKAKKRLVDSRFLDGGSNNSTRIDRKKRVQGLQSDRLEFKVDFETFQEERKDRFSALEKFILRDVFTDESQEPARKKQKLNVDGVGFKILLKQGFELGSGLGKNSQGIVEPLAVQIRSNRKGLRTAADSRLPSVPFEVSAHDAELVFCKSNVEWLWERNRSMLATVEKKLKPLENKLKPADYVKAWKGLPRCLDREWVTQGSRLQPNQVKLSKLMDEDVLTKLLRQRLESPGDVQLYPMTVGDCWLLEGGQSRLFRPPVLSETMTEDGAVKGEQLDKSFSDKLPTGAAVSLLLVLVHCVEEIQSEGSRGPSDLSATNTSVKPEEGSRKPNDLSATDTSVKPEEGSRRPNDSNARDASVKPEEGSPRPNDSSATDPSVKPKEDLRAPNDSSATDTSVKPDEDPREHYMRKRLKRKYQNYLEITANASLPMTSLLRPTGMKGKILFYSRSMEEKIDQLMKVEKVDKDTGRCLFVESCCPGKGEIEVSRTFYLDTFIQQKMSHLDVKVFSFKTDIEPSQLVLIDPISDEGRAPDHANRCLNDFREYACTELASKNFLLSAVQIALKIIAEGGDMVIHFRSIVTRFSATLILLLSFVFKKVIAFRPPSVASWTSSRYMFFQNACVKSAGEALVYVQHAWNVSILALERRMELMQLLPPLCFTNSHFIRWIQEWNTAMAEDELEELLVRNNPSSAKEILRTSEERQSLCETFLEDYKIKGFFFHSDEIEEPVKTVQPTTFDLPTPSGSVRDDPLLEVLNPRSVHREKRKRAPSRDPRVEQSLIDDSLFGPPEELYDDLKPVSKKVKTDGEDPPDGFGTSDFSGSIQTIADILSGTEGEDWISQVVDTSAFKTWIETATVPPKGVLALQHVG